MPSTLFVVKGVESLKSAAEIAFLDSFHDLLEDGEVSLANGRTLVAPDAGVLIAIDTAALAKSDIFSKLSQADQLMPLLTRPFVSKSNRCEQSYCLIKSATFFETVENSTSATVLGTCTR